MTAATLWCHEALVADRTADGAQRIIVLTQERERNAAALEGMQSLFRYQTAHPNPKGDYTPPSHRLSFD